MDMSQLCDRMWEWSARHWRTLRQDTTKSEVWFISTDGARSWPRGVIKNDKAPSTGSVIAEQGKVMER